MKNKIALLLILSVIEICSHAQVGEPVRLPKVSHAEPIYFDLIRDLGARKGEKELNVGMGIASHATHSEYAYLVEYEFAPIDRLGLEIELPLVFRHSRAGESESAENGLEGIKAAVQYSFFVSEKMQTTFAAGYIFERRLMHDAPMYAHNPFFIAAKRWGRQFHTLLYAGPLFERDHNYSIVDALINASVHYMLPGTRNFVGIEVNDEASHLYNDITIRPQIKMALSSASSVGLSLGISTSHSDQPLDFLIRLIYELKSKK